VGPVSTYKWSDDPYKWPTNKWAAGVITPIKGVMGPYLKLGGIGGAPLVDIRWEARCIVFWVLSH